MGDSIETEDGPKLHVLFVCSYNRMRSPTAEAVFSDYPGVETLSAGTSSIAQVEVSSELIEWADVILVMEPAHRHLLRERFGPQLKGKRLEVLGIPDLFPYMDPELVRILRERVPPHLVGAS